MSGKRLCLAVHTVATILSVSAVAQDEKNEVGGLLGRTFISDQGIQNATYFDPIIHSGKGLTFEGEYARRFLVTPIYSVTAEGLLVYNWDVDLNAGQYGNSVVPSDLKKFFITPAARVNLSHDCGFPVDQFWSRLRTHQRKHPTDLRRHEYWKVHDQCGHRGRIWAGCESLEKAQHTHGRARFLGRRTGFSAGSDRQDAPA